MNDNKGTGSIANAECGVRNAECRTFYLLPFTFTLICGTLHDARGLGKPTVVPLRETKTSLSQFLYPFS